MLQALLHLAATQPRWLAGHVEAYADLVTAEAGSIAADWRRRVLLGAIALCCAGVGAVLAGVALMLWAVVPDSQIGAPWALFAAPSLPLLVALACAIGARSGERESAMTCLRQQVQADLMLLREVAAS
jgi:hypothetical protein